jgi:hypothetical protein
MGGSGTDKNKQLTIIKLAIFPVAKLKTLEK